MKLVLTSHPTLPPPEKSVGHAFRINGFRVQSRGLFRSSVQRFSEKRKNGATGWVHAWRAEVKHFLKVYEDLCYCDASWWRQTGAVDTYHGSPSCTGQDVTGAGCFLRPLHKSRNIQGTLDLQDKNLGSEVWLLLSSIISLLPAGFHLLHKVVIPMTSVSC